MEMAIVYRAKTAGVRRLTLRGAIRKEAFAIWKRGNECMCDMEQFFDPVDCRVVHCDIHSDSPRRAKALQRLEAMLWKRSREGKS